MFPLSPYTSTARTPLIAWLVAGLIMFAAVLPATSGAMPGRGIDPQAQSQPQQDLRAPDQVAPTAAQDLRAPDQVYSNHGPLPQSGPLPSSHVVQTPASTVQPASTDDGIDTWVIVAIGAGACALLAGGIVAARKTKVGTVRPA
jgi:hypothetical protein